jgi:hypothetical protein
VYIAAFPLDRIEAQAGPFGVAQGSQFSLANLAPGRYLLLASHQPIAQQLEFRNEEVLRDLLSKGTVVTLGSGQKAQVQVPLLPGEANP